MSADTARSVGAITEYRSAGEAYERGRIAYARRDWDKAMSAMTYASKHGIELADFYRARMYGDSETRFYSRAKAFTLYRSLAKVLADIDPDINPRVRFAGQTLTALARYLRDGIDEMGLKPDRHRALEYLSHAWTFFRDKDAEFELARMRLTGEGADESPRLALHSLSRLARSGHAGALATLAELYWRGSSAYWSGTPTLKVDPVRAYMFAAMAVEHSPYSDRLWIEDIFQRIYCGVNEGVRERGGSRVAGWRKRFGAPAQVPGVSEPQPGLFPRPLRTCGDGEAVVFKPYRKAVVPTVAETTPNVPAMHGGAARFGLDAGGK